MSHISRVLDSLSLHIIYKQLRRLWCLLCAQVGSLATKVNSLDKDSQMAPTQAFCFYLNQIPLYKVHDKPIYNTIIGYVD